VGSWSTGAGDWLICLLLTLGDPKLGDDPKLFGDPPKFVGVVVPAPLTQEGVVVVARASASVMLGFSEFCPKFSDVDVLDDAIEEAVE
jgi:hypothetical protein